jgi:hypothetical protein
MAKKSLSGTWKLFKDIWRDFERRRFFAIRLCPNGCLDLGRGLSRVGGNREYRAKRIKRYNDF